MSDEEDERWKRAHQRKLITVRASRLEPEHEASAAEHQIYRLLGWMNDHANPAVPVDFSDYELAVLACVESPDAVRVALAALVAGGHLLVDPGGAPCGMQQFMCRCPVCHEALAAVHRRALERYYADHMAEEHGQHGAGVGRVQIHSRIPH